MVILHFDLQPQFRYMNYFISTLHHFTPHGRYELNKLASLPMCGFIAQLVEHRTGIAEVTGSNPVEALIFSGFFFQLLKLENLLRWSFFTLIHVIVVYVLIYPLSKFEGNRTIVNKEEWLLGSPANIKGANKDAKI